MQKRRPLTILLTAVVFIALETAAVAVLHFNNELQRSWISGAGHGVMAVLWGGGQKIGDYFRLKSQNDSLAAENFRLSRRVAEFEALEERAAADSAAAAAARGKSGMFGYIPAGIVKVSGNRQHNYLILDKGGEDGVLEGAGIITARGVVGIVEAVSAHYCFCVSFLNYNMSVSARLGKDGPAGTMVWDGMRKATLREIPHHLFTGLRDTVYTSGFSAIFPKDIPLGVTAAASLKDGATYDISVELFEDFGKLRYVTIVNNLDSVEIGALEKEAAE